MQTLIETKQSCVVEETFPYLDSISSVLNIRNRDEMEQRIFDNISKIRNLLFYVKEELTNYDLISLSEKYKESFFQCLKFIDTLNLFIPNNSLRKLMYQINTITQFIYKNKVLQSKNFLLNQISFTEISLIHTSKKEIYELCFVKGNQLTNQILDLIDSLMFRKKQFNLFKQIQNIFYVVNNRLDQNDRYIIQNRINEIKGFQLTSYPNHYYKCNFFQFNVLSKDRNERNSTQQNNCRFKKKVYQRYKTENASMKFSITENTKQSNSPINKEENNKNDKSIICNNTNKYDNPKANKYQISLQSIDPNLLLRIKAKLTETIYNTPHSFSYGYFNKFFESLISCHKRIQDKITFLFNNNKNTDNDPLINFLTYPNDSNIHKEYILLKCQECENPTEIMMNINQFEDKILLPFYKQAIDFISQSGKMYRKVKNIYKKLVNKIISSHYEGGIIIKPYGSLINNFRLEKGDIDICIIPGLTKEQFTPFFIQLKNELELKDNCKVTQSFIAQNSLLLTVLDIQTSISINISVHNINPEYNSNMLRFYSIYDQRFHIMGLYLKHWAKLNKIHKTSEGYLSSYALLLLLISFLQKVNPPVLPYYIELEDSIDYHLNNIKEDVQRFKYSNTNKESVGQLLVHFFEYYSYFFDSNYKIFIRSNTEVKNLSDTAFSIIDYFDPLNDSGNTMKMNSNEYNLFITSMKKEINYILNKEYINRIIINQKDKDTSS